MRRCVWNSVLDLYILKKIEFLFQETLVNSMLFLKTNVLCFLFSRSRRVLPLDASASCINLLLELFYCPSLKICHIDIYEFYYAVRLIDLN